MFRTHNKYLAFVVIIFLFINVYVKAQDYTFNIRQFTVQEGLSHNQIFCLHQDRKGFIWIGTKYGLNRFDGHEFRWFTKSKNDLSSNIISTIVEDEEGLLWLGQVEEYMGAFTFLNVDIFNPNTLNVIAFEDKFENNAPFSDNEIQSINRLPGGQLIFKLINEKFFSYTSKNGFKPLPFKEDFIWLNAFDDQHVWGTIDNELLKIDLHGKIVYSHSIEEGHGITHLQKDYADRIWMMSGKPTSRRAYIDASLRMLSDNKITDTLLLTSFYNPGYVRIIPYAPRQSMLFIYQDELMEIDKDLNTKFHDTSIFAEDPIDYRDPVYVDKQGDIWYGNRKGFWLAELQTSRFRQYLKNENNPFPTRGLAEYGSLLFVNSEKKGGYVNLNSETFRSYSDPYPQFTRFRCFSMFLNDHDELWVANNNLYQLDSTGHIIRTIEVSEGRRSRIWSFFQDSNDTFWIGSDLSKIYYYNEEFHTAPQEFTHYNTFEDLKKTIKWYFLEDENRIWIAAQNGLYLLDRQKGITAQFGAEREFPYYLPANQFHFIHKDTDGNFWLATGDSGLIQWKAGSDFQAGNKHFRQFSREDGFPSNELYAIYEDEYNHLWISTANGIVQFNKENYQINTYFEEQGITHNEFNRLSYFRSSSGRIYFGGLNGITAFDPKDFYRTEAYKAKLIFSDVSIFSGKEDKLIEITSQIQKEKKIIFRPSDKFLTLKLSLQDYFYSDKLKYNYQIVGLHKEMTEINDNVIQLSGLPYGKWKLHIKARGPDNRFSDNELNISLIVARPFYLQWWFICIFIVAIGISIWQYSAWRIQSLQKRQLLLEDMVAERTEQIREDKLLIEEQAKKLLEIDKIKSRFFENISHELRTPLTLILSPLENFLKRKDLVSRDATILAMMRRNGKRLLKLINELLDLSSMDANKMTVNQQRIILHNFMKNILASFESAARQKDILLTFNHNMEQDLSVMIDKDKVERIVYNLLSNAIKFTPKSGRIHANLKQNTNDLHLSVTDSGIGIPGKDLTKIFDRFYQSKSSDNYYEGSGIGLALCHELAGLMNGKVWAESEQGKGSTFHLQLPLIKANELAQPTREAMESIPEIAQEDIFPLAITPSKETILLVEDNKDLLSYISTVLEDYKVVTAENGKLALEWLAASNHPSLIISDIMMPVMDGFELLAILKNNDTYHHIPIIMLTARLKSEDKLEALRIGVDDYMTKPFGETELLVRVANLIKNSRNRLQTATTEKPSPSTSTENVARITRSDIKWLENVEQLILKNIGNSQFSIQQLAGEMALERRHFQQKIKSITGLTPKQYQRDIQLEYARRLLESGDFQSVSEVSYKIGFSDQHYFSTLFKKRYGRMPSAFL